MANNKECAVCKEMMKKKHKYDKFFKIGFFIVLALLIVMIILYCCSGDLFKTSETNMKVNNNHNIDIENNGGNNSNNINFNDGSYTIS